MASHLRFNSTNGTIDARTPEGQFTEELLQLNDVTTVQYRLSTLRTVSMYLSEIDRHELQVKAITQLLRAGKIIQPKFDELMASIAIDLDELRRTMQSYTGELPVPVIPKQRLGVALFE